MSLDYIIGVDLGQAHDYTALTVLEKEATAYKVRHLERLKLGTPYPEQVERVTRLYQDVSALPELLEQDKRPRLVVDQTGVGRPVVDMLREAGHGSLYAVSITGGDTVTREKRDYRVPKRELVSVLQVLLQSDRLGVAAGLPEAGTLSREMLAFKVKFSPTGHDSYGNDWRENDHDDMVLAVALAAWVGERGTREHYFSIA